MTPVEEPMAAMVLSLVLQVPPDVSSARAEEYPWHTCLVPNMLPGSGFTSNVPVTKQPVAKV